VPWEAKGTAPAFVNLWEQAEALLTGTPEEWMVPLLPDLPPVVMDVDEFCRAGPEDCGAFDLGDALSAAQARTRLGALSLLLSVGPKLGCYARQRLFGVYCWNRSETPAATRTDTPNQQTLYLLHTDLPETQWLNQGSQPWHGDIPVTRADWYWIRYQKLSGGLNEGRVRLYDQFGNRTSWLFQAWNTNELSWWYRGTQAAGVPGAATIADCVSWEVSSGPDNCLYTMEIRAYSETNPGVQVTTEPYVPPPAPQPPAPITPVQRTYETISDLGARLDAMNQGIQWTRQMVIEQTLRDSMPLEASGPAFAVDNDTEYGLTTDDAGLLVTLNSPPQWSSELFGSPAQLARVGRVTLGMGEGWYEPIPITVSPLVVTPIPNGATRFHVYVIGPLSATVTRLRRTAPAG
jgi:predicted transcriptional regulator